jgi:hypothetical protein
MITNENIGGAVLLRTLTRKSLMWFGKYEGLRIQQIIDLQKQTYLRWVYYNCNGVSFTKDVLEEIRIKEDRRIPKPGICPEIHDKISQENIGKMDFKSKSHMNKVLRLRKVSKEFSINNNEFASKAVMQACNLHRIKD